MGVVGLNFGSATSGQGFDVASTVNQIVTNLQSVETPWKNQLASLQSKDTALSNLGTLISTLSTDLQSLRDFSGVLSDKSGSSSDPSVLSLLSANSAAVAGTHEVTVKNLARTSTAATLSGLATAINGAGLGVTATLLTNADGSARLSLVSQTSGSAGQITIADSTNNPEN